MFSLSQHLSIFGQFVVSCLHCFAVNFFCTPIIPYRWRVEMDILRFYILLRNASLVHQLFTHHSINMCYVVWQKHSLVLRLTCSVITWSVISLLCYNNEHLKFHVCNHIAYRSEILTCWRHLLNWTVNLSCLRTAQCSNFQTVIFTSSYSETY